MANIDGAGWKLDRHINLPFVLIVLGQVLYGTWMASQYNAAMQNLDARVLKLEVSFKEREITRQSALERIARLEAAAPEQTRRLDRIEQKIDRILETRAAP